MFGMENKSLLTRVPPPWVARAAAWNRRATTDARKSSMDARSMVPLSADPLIVADRGGPRGGKEECLKCLKL